MFSSQIQASSKGLFSWANSRCCTCHEVLPAARSLKQVFSWPRQSRHFWWQCWWEFGSCPGPTGNRDPWGAGERRAHVNVQQTARVHWAWRRPRWVGWLLGGQVTEMTALESSQRSFWSRKMGHWKKCHLWVLGKALITINERGELAF